MNTLTTTEFPLWPLKYAYAWRPTPGRTGEHPRNSFPKVELHGQMVENSKISLLDLRKPFQIVFFKLPRGYTGNLQNATFDQKPFQNPLQKRSQIWSRSRLETHLLMIRTWPRSERAQNIKIMKCQKVINYPKVRKWHFDTFLKVSFLIKSEDLDMVKFTISWKCHELTNRQKVN